MQPKKNPKADLNKDRNLYFVIGLTLVLGVTWGAIEYKTYEKVFDLANLDMLEDDEEEMVRLLSSMSNVNFQNEENEEDSLVGDQDVFDWGVAGKPGIKFSFLYFPSLLGNKNSDL